MHLSRPAVLESGGGMGDSPIPVKSRRTRVSPWALRETVLDAAHELFYVNGYGFTSVEEIARASRTHKMTVYRLFSSKEKLAIAYLERVKRSAADQWDILLRQHHDVPLHVLRTYFAHLAYEVRAESYLGDRSLKLALEVHDASSEIVRVCESHRLLQRERFKRIAELSGFGHSAGFGDSLYLVWLATVMPGRGKAERRRDALSMRALFTHVMLSAEAGVVDWLQCLAT
jgi:AcrR family transcriptional regulator